MIKTNYFNKIDIVYTYVNSTDKKWLNKSKKYMPVINEKRFNYYGEIFYSLLTVQKFFNWVNKIYIVTDDQQFHLNFFEKDFSKKIIFVDHKDIIPKEYLPVFNSQVIECYLWKINGLSDFFLHLNDDIFFGNYIFYNDFFTEDNVFKIFSKKRENPIVVKNTEGFKLSSTGVDLDTAEKLFNNKFKTNIYLDSLHMSWNLNKIACEYTFKLFNKYILRTSKLRIREHNKYTNNIENRNALGFWHLSQLMSIYLKIAIPSSTITNYFTHKLYNLQIKFLDENKPKIFCINDLDDSCIIYWEKFKKQYFKLFPDEYEELVKTLISEKKINNITKKLSNNNKKYIKKL